MSGECEKRGEHFYCEDHAPSKEALMEWEQLTKIKGPLGRHVEQLWEEIKSLRGWIQKLEKEIKEYRKKSQDHASCTQEVD